METDDDASTLGGTARDFVSRKLELVLIGGLTVSCRLGFEHRVTNTTRWPSVFTSWAMSTCSIASADRLKYRPSTSFNDGTKLDVIEVGELDPKQLPVDESNRLWLRLSLNRVLGQQGLTTPAE